jgi:hypothetical protein
LFFQESGHGWSVFALRETDFAFDNCPAKDGRVFTVRVSTSRKTVFGVQPLMAGFALRETNFA